MRVVRVCHSMKEGPSDKTLNCVLITNGTMTLLLCAIKRGTHPVFPGNI